MICPNCNKVYSDDNLFCVECGARLVADNSADQSTPIERFSTRVKASKSQNGSVPKVNKKIKEISNTDNKLDTLILQNKVLIKQNDRIIELLEKLTR